MNEAQFGARIANLLNQGTQLEAATLDRLHAARQRALAAYRPRPVWIPALDGPGRGIAGFAGFSLRVLLPLALVILSGFGLYAWQQKQRIAEIEEIDADLLTDDLPIDALLDRGFEAWLKKQNAR